MKYQEAKEELISAWGTLGQSWGINKTMAQIHALLMLSTKPLSTEDVMQELNISRGNANMNIRALLEWSIVERVFVPGERKEFFRSEKDVWTLARAVAKERRRRELDPIIKVLKKVSDVQPDGSDEVRELKKVTKDLKNFAEKADGLLETFVKSEESWFWNSVLKMLK